MAYLVAVQEPSGEWHAHIVAFPSYQICGDIDVLGRTVPNYCFVEVWDGVRKEDALRLAQTLRGTPKARRRQLILERAESLKLWARGGAVRDV
jgi:hypothetical protein